MTDIGVTQRRDRTRFAVETFFGLRIMGEMGRQDLDRDRPFEPGIACAIHLTHPARAKRRNDLIRPEFERPRLESSVRAIIVPIQHSAVGTTTLETMVVFSDVDRTEAGDSIPIAANSTGHLRPGASNIR